MKTNLLIPTLLVFVLAQCATDNKKIVARKDYEQYLHMPVKAINAAEEETRFWLERLQKNADDDVAVVKLAGLYSEKFKLSGKVADLNISDSLYSRALAGYPDGNVDLFHTLAANAITQHQFRLAADYAQKAYDLKDKRAASMFILTDVYLELGDLAGAKKMLRQITNKHAFAYLIRDAKVKDHEGHLDSAILLMERAYERVKNNKSSAQWTLTNLGDMYGHAGRIQDAYHTYLTALKADPQDGFALKGIAWIALSNDYNTVEAREIIEALALRKRMPEAYLMLAEVANLEGNAAQKSEYEKRFIEMASAPGYKTMYHKYLANLEANDLNNPEACIAIAKQEIINRPTPQSYDLLAWGYFKQKDISKAVEIAEKHVANQTYEPDALYHLGMIYLAAGKVSEAKEYLEIAHESSFELGPTISADIHNTLDTL